MADDFQSNRSCEKCNGQGWFDTSGQFGRMQDLKCWGDTFICSCNCVPLNDIETYAREKLRTTHKVRFDMYNHALNLLQKIKIIKL